MIFIYKCNGILPDLIGYRPVRKAALLGVQSGDAAICWVSVTPSSASLSILGVLEKHKQEKK